MYRWEPLKGRRSRVTSLRLGRRWVARKEYTGKGVDSVVKKFDLKVYMVLLSDYLYS